MRAAVSARSVPCCPVCICSHLLLQNIVILNEINEVGDAKTMPINNEADIVIVTDSLPH